MINSSVWVDIECGMDHTMQVSVELRAPYGGRGALYAQVDSDQKVPWEIGSTGSDWAWESLDVLVPSGAFRLHLVGGSHVNVKIRGVAFKSKSGSKCSCIDTSWLSLATDIDEARKQKGIEYHEQSLVAQTGNSDGDYTDTTIEN
jgi:hypothetical protein